MNNTHNLPSFDVTFSGLYSGTSDLINQSCQFDARKRQQFYQGMSGQTLDSFPVYNSQSDIHNNEAGIFKSLHKYDIVSLTDCNSEIAFGTGIDEIPKSVLDKDIPCSSDDELINDEISSIPNFLFTQQVSLPVNEPDPIPARHSNTDDQLPHPPAVLSDRQDLPPVALVNPANLNQTTSDKQTPPLEYMADSLPVKSQGERRQDPEKRKLKNQYERERLQDPEKRELKNRRRREQRQDPEIRKLINQRQRERRQDPEKRKLMNQRERERRKVPEINRLINQRKRERYRKKMNDPENRKLINQRRRERRQDPEKRKLINQRRREKYRAKIKDAEKRKLINQRESMQRQDPEKKY